jgi:formate dehydrogenase major subunit
VAGLSPAFGRGAMTNHINDFKNTDCALIMGSNLAENHPISMKWLFKAKEERGAKIIHVDPRYTRTSAVADIYAPMRSGTDIAFLGGMIKYILDNELYHKEYVVAYTNASYLIADGFDFKDGLFSGYDAANRKYDVTTWDYQYSPEGTPLKDPTLSNPRCVFQLLKKHYERYDIDTVCKITGTPKDKYMEVLKTFCATGAPNKTGSIMYAMGITQHTVGSQNVKAFTIVQLLLGNMGRPGGGVNAMRGENNVQGATDMALLFHIIPGYIDSPMNTPNNKDLVSFLKQVTPGTAKLPATSLDELRELLKNPVPMSGFKINTPKWVVSMLKAWWGEGATKDNDFGYHYLPKRDEKKNYSHIALFEAMYNKEIEGLFIMGSNPVVGGPNANKEQRAMCNLKWLVSCDLWANESAEFWSYEAWKRPVNNPNVEIMEPKDIQTEVFFLPAAAVYEKEGTASNTGRLVQFRWKGADPVGESKPDLWIIDQIAKRVKKLYEGSTLPQDEPIVNLTWGYGEGEEPDVVLVGKEINGYNVKDNSPVEGFAKLADDGSTACGCWLMSGVMTRKDGKDIYKPQIRDNKDNSKTGLGLYSNWAWCWPLNRRIIYNRCSVQPDGNPWPGDEDRQLIIWNPTKISDPANPSVVGCWEGDDVCDTTKTAPPEKANPFIMRPEGTGCLFATKSSLKEGPFPEHYEPWESPVKNLLSSQQNNPVIKIWEPDKQGKTDKYPLIGTTYRVVEHWQTGALTRNLPWLAELMPNMFIELSEQLAKAKGIKNGDKVIISSSRGDVEAIACVTKRLKPMVVNGQELHEIGTVWHYGYKGFATGDPVNRLTPHVGDANTMIPEYKAWLCDIRRA